MVVRREEEVQVAQGVGDLGTARQAVLEEGVLGIREDRRETGVQVVSVVPGVRSGMND